MRPDDPVAGGLDPRPLIRAEESLPFPVGQWLAGEVVVAGAEADAMIGPAAAVLLHEVVGT